MAASRKKVLYFITKGTWGGAQRYVYDLATGLDPAMFDVTVMLGKGDILKEKLQRAHIRVISVPHLERDVRIMNELKVFIFVLRILARERPSVFHVNSSKAAGIGVVVGRLLNIKHIIFTAHGWAFNEDRSLLSKLLISLMYWIIMVLSHNTIAVSNSIKKQVEHFPFVSRKITIIKNGSRTPELLSRENAREHIRSLFFTEIRSNDSASWVGTVAELHPIKGLMYAIDAINELVQQGEDILYVIIGEGEERNKLQYKIESHGLTNHVLLVGAIPDAARYLPAFDIFLLPSLSEALGYVLLEAGQAHVAVVASDVGGIPEIIRNHDTGLLVPAKKSHDIAVAVRRYVNENRFREQMGAALKQEVEEHFSIQTMITNTVTTYGGAV